MLRSPREPKEPLTGLRARPPTDAGVPASARSTTALDVQRDSRAIPGGAKGRCVERLDGRGLKPRSALARDREPAPGRLRGGVVRSVVRGQRGPAYRGRPEGGTCKRPAGRPTETRGPLARAALVVCAPPGREPVGAVSSRRYCESPPRGAKMAAHHTLSRVDAESSPLRGQCPCQGTRGPPEFSFLIPHRRRPGPTGVQSGSQVWRKVEQS